MPMTIVTKKPVVCDRMKFTRRSTVMALPVCYSLLCICGWRASALTVLEICPSGEDSRVQSSGTRYKLCRCGRVLPNLLWITSCWTNYLRRLLGEVKVSDNWLDRHCSPSHDCYCSESLSLSFSAHKFSLYFFHILLCVSSFLLYNFKLIYIDNFIYIYTSSFISNFCFIN